jgi:hypothetical protein
MTKVGGTALALITAVVVLVVMAWFDTTVVHDAANQAAQTFDSSQYALIASLGMIMIAGAVLLLASLARLSRSIAVGILYVAVGAYFAFQLWIWTYLAGQINAEPLTTAVVNISNATIGPLNAVGIAGGGMLIAGVAVLTRRFRERPGASAPR